MSFALGWAQWAAVAGGALVLALPPLRRGAARHASRALALWLAAGVAALVMTTGWSGRIWEALPPLAFVQFPWRWLMVAAVSLPAVGALLVARVRTPVRQAALVMAGTLLLVGTSVERRTPARILTAAQMPIDRHDLREHPAAMRWGFVEAGYFPRTAGRVEAEPSGRWVTSPEVSSVSPRLLTHDTVRLVVEMRAPGAFTIASFDFPGWRAWIDGRPALVTTQPGTGYLELRLPAGRHEVEARFTDTPVRARANRVSQMSAIVIVVWLATGAAYAWRRRPGTSAVTAPAS
jgi:hypothetical protein